MAVTEDRLVGSDRVLAVLVELGNHPSGIGLDELTRLMGSPKPTVHRALASLRKRRLATQDGYGRYLLGDEFLRIAFRNHEARPEHDRVMGILERLCDRFGETVHFAVLDRHDVVYRAKLDPAVGAMRLTSVIGGRNPAHLTAVGKLLLSSTLQDESGITGWIGPKPLASRTGRSLTTAKDLHAEFERIRAQGYAIDDQENEPGVNCLAVPVYFTSPTTPSGAISISALAHRTPLPKLIDDIDAIKAITAGWDAKDSTTSKPQAK